LRTPASPSRSGARQTSGARLSATAASARGACGAPPARSRLRKCSNARSSAASSG
jgi:hypothetical protein